MLFLLFMNTTEAARERRSKGGTKPREMLDEKAIKALSLQQLKKFDSNVLKLWTNRLNLRQGSSTVMATAIYNHYHPNIETTPPATDDEGRESDESNSSSNEREPVEPPPKKQKSRQKQKAASSKNITPPIADDESDDNHQELPRENSRKRNKKPQQQTNTKKAPNKRSSRNVISDSEDDKLTENRVLEIIETSFVNMLPHLAEAVSNHNQERLPESTEEDPDVLRARALLSRQSSSTHVPTHQYPADILPPVSEKSLKMIKNCEFIDFSTLLPSLALTNPNTIRLEISPDAQQGDQVVAIGTRFFLAGRFLSIFTTFTRWAVK